MVIKNKRGLKRRVESNIREDRLVNRTYADLAKVRGRKKPRAEMCGIGCLGLPHTTRGRLAMIAASDTGSLLNEDQLIQNMGEEFGVAPELALLLEALFVPARRRGIKAAEDFLREFVRRIPEGADINSHHVEAFCKRAGLRLSPPLSWSVGRFGIEQPQTVTGGSQRITNELYEWFDAGARVSKMPKAVA